MDFGRVDPGALPDRSSKAGIQEKTNNAKEKKLLRKMMLLAAVLAMLLIAALPALAQRGDQDNNNHHHNNNHNNHNGDDPAITQDNEQDADSGDVDQSFNVTGGGDNSNQCVGLQGVANTGNAQNQIGVIQYGSEADDFDFEDSGASIEVSPENSTTCDQQVNQAASASGGGR